jgi:hypothetical protein
MTTRWLVRIHYPTRQASGARRQLVMTCLWRRAPALLLAVWEEVEQRRRERLLVTEPRLAGMRVEIALPESLSAYQPQQRYWLIDEGRFTDATLAPLIQAENSTAPEQLARVVANLVVWLEAPERRSLRQAFTEWFNRMLLPGRMPGQKIEPIHDLMEMKAMLAERVKDWTRQWKEEGLAEGIAEGIGKGEVAVLKRQLAKRFGELPPWALEKLTSAPPAQLEAWAERIFDVQSLEQFFE